MAALIIHAFMHAMAGEGMLTAIEGLVKEEYGIETAIRGLNAEQHPLERYSILLAKLDALSVQRKVQLLVIAATGAPGTGRSRPGL